MTGPTSSPIRRSEAVHDRLRSQILDGHLQPGDPLPSERVLSAELGVNRHAVREAVKRLQQAGLVSVTHGGATRVLDWREHGGLELLADLGERAVEVLPAIAEMRVIVGADAARLCARRADGDQRAEIEAVAARYDGTLEAYEELWQRIVDGAGNVAYRLAYNSLVGARHGRGLDAGIYAAELADGAAVRALAEAVARGDDGAAADTARELLGRTLRGLG